MKKIIILSILILCVIPSLSYAITCPAGSHYETDAYGPTCKTDQIVNSPNTPQSNIQTNSAGRICPYGSYLGKDAYGNQACLDSHTNQIVSSPNTAQSNTGAGDTGTIIGIVVFIIIIVIIAGVVKASKKPTESYKDVERKRFSFITTERVKELQKGKCAEYERYPTHWEFDHIDTRGDNSIENCQGLCRDCHQKKTLDDDWRNTRN